MLEGSEPVSVRRTRTFELEMAVRTPRRAELSRAPDGRLAALAAAGDESAFEAIFERHHRGLLALCRHLLGSLEEAEDALQHTFAAAYRQFTEREPPRNLRAWLYASARNRCLDVLRTRRELPAGVAPASTAGLSEEVERRSDLRELVDDIRRLPEDQRAALVMSEIAELEHAEVAEVLGCPREKVRALVYQARSSLSGWREARALPCRDVRRELAVARGGALRRAHLRRHLKVCPECAAFRQDVDRQRRRLVLVLPVLPTLGLKERVLEAASAASAGGGAAGGAAAGGGLGSLGAAMKIGAAVLVLGAGAATFGGPSGDGGLSRDGEVDGASTTEPASERSAPSPLTPAGESRRRRAGASPTATEPDQPGEEVHAAPQSPDAAPSSSQPAPEAPQTPAPQTEAPTQQRDALPDVEVEAEVGVEVEVEPPAPVP
jgi:RNA polymerase sigma factor (sigma-70 family)